MNLIETYDLSPAQKAAVIALWNREYPQQLKFAGTGQFDLYLAGLNRPLHLLRFDRENKLLGWALLFKRDGETWFALIIDRTMQNHGLGSRFLKALKEKAGSLNGWVVNHSNYIKDGGEAYESPLPFYLKNGFTAFTETRLETDALLAVKIVWTKDK